MERRALLGCLLRKKKKNLSITICLSRMQYYNLHCTYLPTYLPTPLFIFMCFFFAERTDGRTTDPSHSEAPQGRGGEGGGGGAKKRERRVQSNDDERKEKRKKKHGTSNGTILEMQGPLLPKPRGGGAGRDRGQNKFCFTLAYLFLDIPLTSKIK